MTLEYFKDYQELFQGCVAYWDGSVNTTLQDIIGGYHGTITTATRIGTDRFGFANKCYNLSASGSKISCGNVLNSVIAGSTAKFTICAWIYPTVQTPTYHDTIFCKSADMYFSEDQRQFYLTRNSSSKVMRVMWAGALTTGVSVLITGTTPLEYNTWWHVTVTFDATTSDASDKVYIFVNGAFDSRNATVYGSPVYIQTGSAQLGLGSMISSSGSIYDDLRFKGNLGEFMVFNNVLSRETIKTLYNLTKTRYLYPIQAGTRGVE